MKPAVRRGMLAGAVVTAVLVYAGEPVTHNDVQLRAMSDELARSKTLQLNNLDKPYFIQYAISDTEQASDFGEPGRNHQLDARKIPAVAAPGSRG